jgi:predicted Zn-dependent peptidase
VSNPGGCLAEEALESSELGSGVRVLTERVAGTRSVSLGVWIDTGSRDEAPGEYGLSHFVEHMLFKGTPLMNAREIAEAFDYMGADINAATGREHTSIYSRALEEHIDRAVEIVMDMARNSLMESGEIDSERQVVLEEINMHYDSPDEMVHDYLANTLWGDHPIGHSVLGEIDTIRNLDREKLSKFFASRYVASRLVVSAAGAVEHERMCELVERLTEGIDTGEPALRDDGLDIPSTGKYIHRKDTEQAHVSIGARGLPRRHPDRFALSVLDNILGGSMSSRLFQKVREEMGLVYSIYSFSGLFLGMGMVGVYFGTHPSQAERVMGLVEEELLLARDQGFSARELDRAKNHIKGSLLISNEDSGNRMNRIAKAEMSGGEHLTIDEMVERVDKVTIDDLHNVFAETWGKVGASLAVVGPFDEDDLSLSGRI